jgi:predicted SnoaL-like aldol condensation-catalyzing enzyme
MKTDGVHTGLKKEADHATPGKKLVYTFFNEFFNRHDMEAIDKYVHPDYVQHDFDVPPGRDGLRNYFTRVFEMFPYFHVNILHVIEDSDMIVMHGYGVTDPGKIEVLVCDIYRIKDGLLYEHWGTIQPLAPDQFADPASTSQE